MDTRLLAPLFEAAQDVIIKELVTPADALELADELRGWLGRYPQFELALPDGSFFPLPYSTVRSDTGRAEEARQCYFNSALCFLQAMRQSELPAVKGLLRKLEQSLDMEPLTLADGAMLPIGTRILSPMSNGIDIHCENAFLNQLSDGFKEELLGHIDLENVLSLFITLASAESGGDLVIFNHEWKDVQIEVNRTSYGERHDLEGSMFTNRGVEQPLKTTVRPQIGSGIIFRAAQVWHAVSPTVGQTDRITIGLFIAKGKDGKTYYWA